MMIEDQYFHQQYLLAAEKIIDDCIDQKQYQKALDISYQVLSRDNLWESAYRSQMRIFHELGQPSMLRKVFRQCQKIFSDQLDVSPSDLTIDLFNKLTSSTKID
jgi:DNA-binding SARP family transcriptional activator